MRPIEKASAAFVLSLAILMGQTPVSAEQPRGGATKSVTARALAKAPASSSVVGATTGTPTVQPLEAASKKKAPPRARTMRAAAGTPAQLALPSAASSNIHSRPSTGYIAPRLGGVAPRPGLDVMDLPEADAPDRAEERFQAPDWADHVSGENRDGYTARVRGAVENVDAESKAAIRAFSNGGFRAIRQSEESGTPNTASDAIQRAFKVARPEPGTVYRGIEHIDKSTVQKWLQWDHKRDGPFRLGRGNVGATSSTAWDPWVAARSFMGAHGYASFSSTYKVLFKIQQRSGIPIEAIAAFDSRETEVLLSRSAEFRIHSIARWRGTKNVLLVELDEL